MPSIVEITGTLSLDTSDFDSKLSGAADRVDHFTSSAGSGKIDLGGAAAAQDLDTMTSATERAASGIESMNEHAKESGRSEDIAMAAEQISAWSESLGAFSDVAIANASDLNEAQSAVNTVYGDSAGVINDFAASAAQNLGMTQSEALATSGQLGAMFSSMGLGTAETADMSTQLLQTAADLGSFHNAMPTEAMDALRSGLIGESEPLRKFGILLSDDAVKAEAVKEGIIQQGEAMTDQQKVQARYGLIMSQIGAAQGDFARTSDGVANATRIQEAAMADLQAQIGQGLLPMQLQQMQLQGKLVGAMAALPPQLIQFGATAAFAAGSAAPMLQSMAQMTQIAPAMMGAMQSAGGAIKEFAAGGELLGLSLGPLLIVLGLVAAAVVAYKTNFLGFADLVNGAVDAVKNFAEYLMVAWRDGEQFNDYLANLPGFLQPIASALGGVIVFVKDLVTAFGNARDAGLEPFQAAILALSSTLKSWGFGDAAAMVQDFGGKIREVMATIHNFTELFAAFRDEGLDPVTSALAALNTMFPQLNGALEVAYDLWTNWLDAITGVANGLRDAFTALTEGDLGGVMAGLGDAIGAALGGALDQIAIVGGALLQAFQAIDWNAVGGTIQAGLSGLTTWFLNAFNAIDWSAIAATLNAGLQAASTTILTWVGEQSGKIMDAFNQVDWSTVASTIGTGIQNALTALGDFAGFLSGKGAELLQGFINDLTAKWPDVQTYLQTVFAGVPEAAGELTGLLLGKGADLITGLVTGIGNHLPEVGLKLGEIGTNVAAMLPDAITLLLQKGADLIAGLVQGIGDHLPDVTTKLGDVSTNVAALLPDALTLLAGKGADLIAGLVQGIGDHLPDIATKLGEIATNIADTLPDALTLLATKGADLIAGLLQGITDKWPEVDAWLANLATDVAETVGDFGTILLAKGEEIITSLKAGIDGKWPEVDAWLAALPQDIMDTVGSLASTLLDKGTELLNGLYTGALDFWNNTAGPWVQSVPQLILDALGSLADTLMPRGQEAITGLQNGALDVWNNVLGPWLQSLPQLIMDAVGALADTLMAKGQELLNGLYQGALDMWNNTVGPWFQSLPQLITDALGNLGTGLVEKGSEIMGLLLQGLQSGWDAITNWVSGLSISWPTFSGPDMSGVVGAVQSVIPGAQQAIQQGTPAVVGAVDSMVTSMDVAARGGLLAHSPSMLFYEIFQSVPEGVVMAIEDGAPDVEMATMALAEPVDKLETNLMERARRAGHEFVVNLTEVLNSGADLMRDAAGHIVDQFGNVLAEDFSLVSADFMAQTSKMFKDVTDAASTQIDDGAPKIAKSGKHIAHTFTDSMPKQDMIDKGAELDAGLQTGIDANAEKPVNAMREVMHKIRDALKTQLADMRTTVNDALSSFWEQRMTETPEFFESIDGMTALAVDAAKTHVDKLKAYVAGTELKIQWIEGHMPTEGTQEYAAALEQISALQQERGREDIAVTAAMANENVHQIKTLKDQIKHAKNPAREAALRAQLALEQRELGLTDQLGAAQNELAMASTDAGREVAQIKIDSITAQLSDLKAMDPAAVFSSLATEAKTAMDQTKTDMKTLADTAVVQGAKAGKGLSDGIVAALPDAAAGINAMKEPLTQASDAVTVPVIDSFTNMRDQVKILLDDMVTNAWKSVGDVNAAIDAANTDGGGSTGDGTGNIHVHDKGGHGKDASGGTFTHGDIDEGANVDVDVSGGHSVDRDSGGHGNKHGGDVHIHKVEVRDDRGLIRTAKNIQRQQDRARSRGK